MIHFEPFDGAGETFLTPEGHEFHVEDYWDRVVGRTWIEAASTNPAAHLYALRQGLCDLPPDDNVVYGKDECGLGHIMHVSELERAE